jgi:hypothetical protein
MKDAFLFFLLFGAAACGATDDATLGGGDEGDDGEDVGALATSSAAASISACPKQHVAKDADGDSVVFCDGTFPEAPLVRPPADDTSADKATLFVALSIRGSASSVVDRTGASFILLGTDGKPLDLRSSPSTKFSRQLRMPSNRYLYTIYRVEGRLTTTHDEASHSDLPALALTKAAPAILLPGKVIDTAQIGAWEGTLPSRVAHGTGMHLFDASKSVPFRVSFTRVDSHASHFRKWTDGSLPDGDAYTVEGTVDNWSKAVTGSDGKCIPALTSMGAKNPLAGATSPKVSLARIAGMHFPGDDEHVLTLPAGAQGWSPTTMGSFGRFRMSDFLSSDVAHGTMFPHGMPTGAQLSLGAVQGGGDECTP